MTDPTHAGAAPRDPAWELLPAYALDAVDDLERRSVERLVASDDDARRALAEYRAVVSAMVPDVEPPAALRSDVLDRLTETTPRAAPSSTTSAERAGAEGARGRRARRRWGVAGIAAAAVVAIAIPTGVAVHESRQRADLEDRAQTVAAMLADPQAQLVTGTMSTGGDASVLVAGDQVLFTGSGMSPAGSGKDYQLWKSVDGKTMVSVGLVHADDGSAALLFDAPGDSVFAITVEPAGGSEQPTTDPVVALQTAAPASPART
ncbi:anti-sigma factor domain-containing protein [Luteimicrobium sp. DT211]|uniref:anti-sigma factor n=1 Tax=Luteimicrobium sp. DT211 TaxID=3393412 RepID=UPI003CF434EA